jgi:hypothetical protein
MKKILITGSTSSQCSISSNNRNLKFGGLLKNALSFGFEYEVTLTPPKVSMTKEDIEKYDVVLVGLSPLTSMSSHYMYGALSVLGHALDIGNGFIFLDSPEPHSVFSSIKNCAKGENYLFKDFFASKAESCEAKDKEETRKHLLDTVRRISNCNEHLKILFPSLPWSSNFFEDYKIDLGDLNVKMSPVNLDIYLYEDKNLDNIEPKDGWFTDKISNKWVKSVHKTLSGSLTEIPKKYISRDEVTYGIAKSFGYLLPTHKYDQPWWSQNVMNALVAGTPVFTDWKFSSILGAHWGGLPASYISMTPEERVEFSKNQLNTYLIHVPNKFDALATLEDILSLR